MGDLSTTGKGSVSDLHMSQILRACHLYHRATEGYFSSSCDGPVRAYMCDVSSGIFLTEAVGMTAWRAEAGRCPPGTPRHRTAHLPVSKYLRGNCDACSSRVRRAAKRAADRPADAVPPPGSVFPPTLWAWGAHNGSGTGASRHGAWAHGVGPCRAMHLEKRGRSVPTSLG